MSRRNNRRTRQRRRRIFFSFFILIMIFMISFLFIKRNNISKMRYCIDYDNYVQKYSKERDLDPLFVHSVIFAESGHDPNAVSERGAVGLMQIMPETGYWISKELGRDDFDETELKDPETNIDMGTWLLRYLLNECDDSERNALAAYNAGIGNVSDWLENHDYSSDGQNLDVIPFKETSEYVDRITYAYDRYRELYNEDSN